ncbi:MAG TPA: alpha/beta hydrolase [Dehalococcoidia bacterium]|nr:alpha/beta hydrolase [Dehalococcoidia bacterium]
MDVDGYAVHCIEEGAGPPIVLVHGFGGSTFTYREVIPLLARHHRVIAFDLKGCGYSARGDTGLSHGDQVAMIHGLFDVLGVEQCTLVGHSMGGAVVQRFAATYPQRVDALVLAASATGDERLAQHLARGLPQAVAVTPVVIMLEALTSAVSHAVRQSTLLSRALGSASYLRLVSARLVRLWSYDASALTEDVIEGYARPMRIRGTLAATLRSVSDATRDAPINRSQITMPVLLLFAPDDDVAPLSSAAQLQAALPRAQLRVIAGAAHLLLEERPAECAQAIEKFVQDEVTSHGEA